MKLPRRRFLHLAAGAAALPAVSRFAWAQTYPTRPVRIIVGFPAGGADRHHRAPDGSMAVGAAGSAIRTSRIGLVRPAMSPPRRWSARRRTAIRFFWPTERMRSTRRFMTISGSISFATSSRSRASIAFRSSSMHTHHSEPKTVAELIAYAKANPGKLSIATPPKGTGPSMAGELFKLTADIE